MSQKELPCSLCGEVGSHAVDCIDYPDNPVFRASNADHLKALGRQANYMASPGWYGGRFGERVTPYFLGFEKRPTAVDRFEWTATPVIPFRIDGLLVWGVDATTLIHRFQVGADLCIGASRVPVPALIFSAGYDLQTFEALLRDQMRPAIYCGELIELPRHMKFQKAIERTLSPATSVTIEISGPIGTLVMWGYGVTS